MANFGARLAYPRHTAPAAAPATAPATITTRSLGARLRRAVRALLRSIDDAPFDLAWPPTYRLWPVNGQEWRADQRVDAPVVERTELRRAA